MKSPAEVVSFFGVSENTGLTPDQVKKNLAKYGPNGEKNRMEEWAGVEPGHDWVGNGV